MHLSNTQINSATLENELNWGETPEMKLLSIDPDDFYYGVTCHLYGCYNVLREDTTYRFPDASCYRYHSK